MPARHWAGYGKLLIKWHSLAAFEVRRAELGEEADGLVDLGAGVRRSAGGLEGLGESQEAVLEYLRLHFTAIGLIYEMRERGYCALEPAGLGVRPA